MGRSQETWDLVSVMLLSVALARVVLFCPLDQKQIRDRISLVIP